VKEGAVPDAEIDRAVEAGAEEVTTMAAKRRFQPEALQYTHETFIGSDPERVASYEQELVNIEVAKLLYELRTEAGLS
jgi:hypothetical protein